MKEVFIFDLNKMECLRTLAIDPNPKGLMALSADDSNSYLLLPQPAASGGGGDVIVYGAGDSDLRILHRFSVHQNHQLSAMALSSNGLLLATASELGTVVRIFTIPMGTTVCTLRRGSYPTTIYDIAFNARATRLAVSASTGTIHIFKVPAENEASSSHERGGGSLDTNNDPIDDANQSVASPDSGILHTVTSSVNDYLTQSFSVRAFATAKLKECSEVPNVCALMTTPSMNNDDGMDAGEDLIILTRSGTFHQFRVDTLNGGLCSREEETLVGQPKYRDDAVETDPSRPNDTEGISAGFVNIAAAEAGT
mmetsp:Transcript_25129/g.34469  ORF Transcript_25129/g.34469 Transcript_25129/m.34469 type:complete len:310 (-) Transcript_25129:241-1170(-)